MFIGFCRLVKHHQVHIDLRRNLVGNVNFYKFACKNRSNPKGFNYMQGFCSCSCLIFNRYDKFCWHNCNKVIDLVGFQMNEVITDISPLTICPWLKRKHALDNLKISLVCSNKSSYRTNRFRGTIEWPITGILVQEDNWILENIH